MSPLSRLAAALLAAAPALAAAQWPDEEEPDGPAGLQVTALAGGFAPTGRSLEGFPWGMALAGRLGWRFGGYGLELDVRRASSTHDEGVGSLQMIQTSFTPALRIFGTIAGLTTEGHFGLGWYTLRLNARGGPSEAEEAGQSRLGLQLGGAVAIPVAGPLELLVGATYGGAYSTVFDYEPVWIAGWALEAGLRFTLSTGRPAERPSGTR